VHALTAPSLCITVHAGETVDLKVVFTPTIDVTGGSLDVSVKLGKIKVADASFDVCTQLGVSCPLAAGKQVRPWLAHPVCPHRCRWTWG
jgi:hypothetical protein